MFIYDPNRGFVQQPFVAMASDTRTAAGAFVGWLMTSRTARDIYDWANYIGVVNVVDPADMHATIIYAPDERLESDVHGDKPLPMPVELGQYNNPQTRILGKPGSPGALVTAFDSDRLAARHRYYRDVRGFKHSFPEYLPHVTLSYDAASQDPQVIGHLIRFPCCLPFCFDRERVAPANPPS